MRNISCRNVVITCKLNLKKLTSIVLMVRVSNDALRVTSRDVSSRLVCTLVRVLPLNWGVRVHRNGKEAIATSKRDRREGRTARRESDAGQERKNEHGCAHLLPVLISRLATNAFGACEGQTDLPLARNQKLRQRYAKRRAR